VSAATPASAELLDALRATRATLPALLALGSAARADLVRAMAAALRSQRDALLAANALDLDAARAAGQGAALLDRLRLDAGRIDAIATGLEQVAELPDPLADDTPPQVRPNGLRIRQKPAPLGVVAMVYEARPNVTAEAAALCIRAGNACVLRGGREAARSNQAIAAALHAALAGCGIERAAVRVLDDPDRRLLAELLLQDELIDLVIPRGGEALIRHVATTSRIPVIRHYKGVCHLYLDRAADPEMALRLAIDGKTSRPAVCNATECLLVHREVAATLLPPIADALQARGVELRGCPAARAIVPAMQAAADADWGHEFLDLRLAVRVVDDLDAALAHIRRHGSNHTEAICTADRTAAARFIAEVDASAVVHNASTRFNDGSELGLGAEIGISTSKLHAYGPMGLASLTCRKWVVEGEGQVRHAISRPTGKAPLPPGEGLG
jgi:glutamate-5-semialdehyde dehydrogenase